MDEFANLFLSKRIEKGLSQDEIAGMLNVTRQAVSKWENGKAMPDISLMPRIAEIFDVSLDELLTGNKPKSVENDDINEKKVAKPRQTVENILPFFAPLACVLIVAIILLCLCIPVKPLPPAPEPEPTIEYLATYVKGSTLTDDNIFQAELIAGKAYYRLEIFSSNYTLYITAPQGAVAYLNDEKIIEFESSKTAAYTRYFKEGGFVKNEKYGTESDGSPSSIREKEYVYDSDVDITDADRNIGRNLLVLDLTNCSEDDCVSEKQSVNIKPQMGFDNVVIPAHGTYYASYRFCDIADTEDMHVHRYNIKSEGVRFVQMLGYDHGLEKDGPYYRTDDFINREFNDLDASAKQFYIIEPRTSKSYTKVDLRIAFVNTSDRDQLLELEDMPIEEIELGQLVSLDGHGMQNYPVILKFSTKRPIVLQYKYTRDPVHEFPSEIVGAVWKKFVKPSGSLFSYYEDPFITLDLPEGWVGCEALDLLFPGDYYIFLQLWNCEKLEFVINDSNSPVEEFTKD